ncbi:MULTISPECIES: patatin family protein [unclassified Bacillus (in: firmicutes)]|uniref:patatin-like phospholipase family protein n=1 Tax=unclassified Bacillus (in: firmicutes) TaxID=185979 RepID=UPI0008EBC1BB|nr:MULTISPECIES: patatin family protein [unclassified Bacillus (in: firmicutes)]SFI73380.1 Predicted phospholipase, patatin/cPLA2 family [Bacillus sp. 71mf]SFS88297.1 Predicted phospholipase, patatin/cPLA2 family [Bacillus sp. 103mf]
MNNIGLVLEGGGMKGLYTAGVLEYFMEQNLYFPYVIGVSAGACMAATYLSRQKGRNKKVNTELVSDPRYISFRNFLRKRELFGMDFLFDEVPNKIVPFDFQTFQDGAEQFVIGTTDCETGEAVYYNKHEHGDDILKIIRASSSVPFIAPVVEYDDKRLLDGGITDPIPIQKAQGDGYQKNVVIMTKPAGYKKQPSKLASIAKWLYRQYPNVADRLAQHSEIYNNTISYLYSEEQKENFFVIQPSVQLPVSGLERNQERLVHLYELGYNDAKNQFEQLKEWSLAFNKQQK